MGLEDDFAGRALLPELGFDEALPALGPRFLFDPAFLDRLDLGASHGLLAFNVGLSGFLISNLTEVSPDFRALSR